MQEQNRTNTPILDDERRNGMALGYTFAEVPRSSSTEAAICLAEIPASSNALATSGEFNTATSTVSTPTHGNGLLSFVTRMRSVVRSAVMTNQAQLSAAYLNGLQDMHIAIAMVSTQSMA